VTKDGRELILATAEVKAKLSDLLAGKPADPKKPLWTGGFEARALRRAARPDPGPREQRRGRTYRRTIAIKGLNEAPSVAIDLDLPDLQIGRDYFFERGSISLHIDPRKEALPNAPPAPALALIHAKDTAVARVELVGQDGGSLRASAFAGITWQNKLIPTVDQESAADFLLSAPEFPPDGAPARGGRRAEQDRRLPERRCAPRLHRVGDSEKGKIEADMSLTKGVLYVPQLGQEFQDAKLRLIATKEGVIRVDDIGARASTGEVKGWALARFDGLTFQDAAAELTIGEAEPLPVSLEGVPLGRLNGKIAMTAKTTKEALIASVKIPSLNLELPASIGRNVQPLDENEEIVTSHPIGKPEEEAPREEGAKKVVVNIDLDRARIKGSMVDVSLKTSDENPLRIELTDKTRIFGDIETIAGRLNVMSKEFEIERVLVHMRGQDEPNPYVNATVRWDAPDGSRIFIDFIGSVDPITEEKIRFRSDPTRSKQEIIGGAAARLGLRARDGGGRAFGRIEGADALDGQRRGRARGGVRGRPVQRAARRLGHLDERRDDRGGRAEDGHRLREGHDADAGDVRGRGVWGCSRAGGAGGASRRTGRTEVSVDWRFEKNWMLRGMVGVGGDQPSSGLDLLWQYRY
jgi:translocation and assembly module TamB